jgi:prepilin-type processing-associated H-X9-DG protein
MVADWGWFVFSSSEAVTGIRTGQYMPGVLAAGGTCAANIWSLTDPVDNAPFQKDCEKGRHLGGINIAYADGHVKWLKGETVRQERVKDAANQPNAFNPASIY